jgi:diguanylate cyclase (GGDEF)-like protein
VAEAVAEPNSVQRRWLSRPSALPYRRASGVVLVTLLIAAAELLGRPAWLDPAVFLPIAALAGAALGGMSAGVAAAAVGGLYLLLAGAQHDALVTFGSLGRVFGSLVASGLAIWVGEWIIARGDSERAAAAAAARRSDLVSEFAARMANEVAEQLPQALANGAADVLEADMAVLTVLDPPSGRHFVRATFGGGGSAVGVEVLPGVGITGQAIRDRRLVVTGAVDATTVNGLKRRLRGRSTDVHSMAAVAGLQQGRVIASLTIGRQGGEPFSRQEQHLLESVMSLTTLAVAGSLVRSEVEQGSPRDPLTGLYNRPYLDATLEQILALRRRTSPEARPPLSMIMFDIDGFGQINERHGRQVGDQVLRAVATLLRQRFRASDIVARVGGDSFFVVLNGATADITAEAAAHIRRQVRELTLSGARGEPLVVSISAGCALFHDGEKPESLFRSVEAALETARWSGPGAVVSI